MKCNKCVYYHYNGYGAIGAICDHYEIDKAIAINSDACGHFKAVPKRNKSNKELYEILRDNYNLPIIPLVGLDVVYDDEHPYWQGQISTIEVAKCAKHQGVLYLEKDAPILDENNDEIKIKKWDKAIILYIKGV